MRGMGAVVVVVAMLFGAALADAQTRTPSQWPFDASSPWNTPLGTGAQYATPTCDTQVRAEASNTLLPWINAERFGVPVFTASSTDPEKPVHKSDRPDLPIPNGPEVGRMRIPSGAAPDPGSDRTLVVQQPSTPTVRNPSDETWLTYNNLTWVNVGHYVRVDLRGSGWGSGIRAARASIMGGLIRTWELQAGSIKHALAMALTPQRMDRRWVAPASNIDNWNAEYAGPIPMGQLLALPPEVSIDSLGLRSPAGRTIAQALKTYGAYVVDTGGAAVLYTEPTARTLVEPARNNDATGDSDMKRIVRALRCVSNNTPAAWGGGGTPLAPPAPAWSN